MELLPTRYSTQVRIHDKMKTVGDYEFDAKDKKGSGAFSIVYKGRYKKNLDQVVAIKKVLANGDISKSLSDPINRETEILKTLSNTRHTNIVTLLHCEKRTDHIYFVMEFCNGGNLREYLQSKQKLDEGTISVFLRQIAVGLKVAHDMHIVHRDLKPENIILCFAGPKYPSPDNITLKIADFGIGRFLKDDEMARTHCGTPLYMAPEILLQRPGGYDYKADLWSVGVIAYECLVGSLARDSLIALHGFQNPQNATKDFTNLLQGLLENDANKRFTLKEVFDHQLIGRKPEHEYKPHPQKTYTSTITVKPPASFKPIPIQEKDTTPKPAVPSKPFKDTRIFQNVDTHAVEVSKEEHKTFRELVWHLIYAREITNELEKARAIFIWLCSKDLTKLNFGNVQKGSPEESLMNLQRGHKNYTVVFKILCSYAGLHCKTIIGYAKGAEYKLGMKFTGKQSRHSWNVVLVNGAWRLVDCNWAAKRFIAKMVSAKNECYELDEYYFMPYPHQLIFSHFPDDISWQLLVRSITLADFENLVPVKPRFFKYGLQILGHRETVIHTKQEVTIRIGCPSFKAPSLAFAFTVVYDSGKEEFKGINLHRFGMHDMVDNVSFFTIRPPEKGSYHLFIYAKDLEQQTKEDVYYGVCAYELVCEAEMPFKQMPFPPCVNTSWGHSDSADKYSLVPMQKGAIFSTVYGQAEVRFKVPKELRFTAKLKSNDKDEKALAGYTMHRVVGDVVVFTINAPSQGEFGLEIHVNDPEVDGNLFYYDYQYLIICNETLGVVEPLPTLPPGYLGPQPTFKKLGLSTVENVDPYIQTDIGEIQVVFSMTQPLCITSKLIYLLGNRNDDRSEYILQQSKVDTVIFFMKLPKTGFYKFQVFAVPFSGTSEDLSEVYNYLINFTNTQATLVPYPKQYLHWRSHGCYLYEPLEGTLQRNRKSKGSASTLQHYYFKMDVPKADSVAVVVGEDWTQLVLKPSGSWEGEVNLEKHWGHESKVAICVHCENEASYNTLLEYSM